MDALEPVWQLGRAVGEEKQATMNDLPSGLTVKDVAKRYRVGRDKVRGWINRGELMAINVAGALCGKARFVVLPEHLAAFEQRRAAAPPPKSPRQRKRPEFVDYFPDAD